MLSSSLKCILSTEYKFLLHDFYINSFLYSQQREKLSLENKKTDTHKGHANESGNDSKERQSVERSAKGTLPFLSGDSPISMTER